MPEPTLVLVGLRRPAIESAERLGFRVALVAETAPGPQTASRVECALEASFDAPPEAWAALADSLRPLAPVAVVALTERSVVPAAHLRAALGLAGLSPEAAHLCTHKGAMKRAIRAAGVPCADFVEASGAAPEACTRDALIERLGLPMVLKTCVGSGGRGTYVAREVREVPERLPEGWMAEAFLDGTEMSAEGFGAGDALRALNPTQYLVVGQASVVPGPLAAPEAVRDLKAAAWRALGVERGTTHLEVFQTASGAVFGEMAARPPGGYLMRLISLAYGVDAWALAFRSELGEAVALPPPEAAAAAWILHPGAGTVREASGVDLAREMPGVVEATVRVCPGDRVEARAGTGQEVGHLIVTGATAPEAEARLRAARAAIRLEVETG